MLQENIPHTITLHPPAWTQTALTRGMNLCHLFINCQLLVILGQLQPQVSVRA